MKTVEFTYSFDPFLYRTNSKEAAGVYVLASEANERIKVLEAEKSEIYKDMNEIHGEYRQRIKVLEDALREILDGHLWRDERPNIDIMRETARIALEVKP